MLFNTLEFARFFVVAFVGCWLLARYRLPRIVFLLLASYFFYSRWEAGWGWRYLPLLLVILSSSVDWAMALTIDGEENPVRRKRWLLITVVLNLGLLGFFKYWNFGLATAQDLSNALSSFFPSFASASPVSKSLTLDLALPIGISFYTFESMSYVIDVYRREMPACRNYLQYLLFVAFFPHLVAGPIVRPKDLLPQLGNIPRELDAIDGGRGLFLVAIGLLKKVALGDYLAVNLVDRVFDRTTTYSAVETLAGVYGYAFQIYCDFSGYTDIAIGCALLLGVRLNKNFLSPYQSTSLQEFWRRWHISLSTWLRDYLYISLGGNRGSRIATYRNLMLTMLLGGLWHGASWTFVFWGFLHGAGLVVGRLWEERFSSRRSKVAEAAAQDADTTENAATETSPYREASPTTKLSPRAEGMGRKPRWVFRIVLGILTFHYVCFAWIFFRADSFSKAITVLKQIGTATTFHPNLPPRLLAVLAMAAATHMIPDNAFERLRDRFAGLPALAQGSLLFLAAVILREVASSAAVPFVYFQF